MNGAGWEGRVVISDCGWRMGRTRGGRGGEEEEEGAGAGCIVVSSGRQRFRVGASEAVGSRICAILMWAVV